MGTVLMNVDPNSVFLALVLGLIFLVLFEILRIHVSRGRTPPGPRPFPFLGTLPYFIKDPMGSARSIHQYGEMATVYIGRQQGIVLNTLQLTKEALVQEGSTFSGRPALPLIDWITNGLGIIMVTFGHSWRQQRRFALHTLRNFGLGKKSVEERVSEEGRYLVAEMLKEGTTFDPKHVIQNAVSNIICSIVFGDRFDYDNKRFAYLLKVLNENFILTGSAGAQMFNLVPSIKHFPGPHQKMLQNTNELLGFIREEVNEHRQTLDPENPRDFIDAYLLEIDKQKSQEDSTFHEQNMFMSTADLFLAGTDTTATTIRWGLIFLMENPEVQERCHEEIVQVLGYDGQPSMDDRDKLPYTQATVHEIQRCANIVPFGVVHATTQPTKLRGYNIPKGTMIMTNLTRIFSDEKHWKSPDTFNPENFLDENRHFYKPEAFIPFSLGPRVCPGETLARTELFLYIVTLLQRIHFSWPPNSECPDMDGIMGVVRFPHPFKIVCRSRDAKY
ncbi:cytochrome P450 2B4-like [Triplophysa dalaica]|uniref:cytochrome P450 2B4-like n=1 Tax=Triplophysa dalaica TaxID=1582913 RepID=UPI0024DFE3FE|nr:cytochrome P450 2B4-like [Triplophysa dalaica]